MADLNSHQSRHALKAVSCPSRLHQSAYNGWSPPSPTHSDQVEPPLPSRRAWAIYPWPRPSVTGSTPPSSRPRRPHGRAYPTWACPLPRRRRRCAPRISTCCCSTWSRRGRRALQRRCITLPRAPQLGWPSVTAEVVGTLGGARGGAVVLLTRAMVGRRIRSFQWRLLPLRRPLRLLLLQPQGGPSTLPKEGLWGFSTQVALWPFTQALWAPLRPSPQAPRGDPSTQAPLGPSSCAAPGGSWPGCSAASACASTWQSCWPACPKRYTHPACQSHPASSHLYSHKHAGSPG